MADPTPTSAPLLEAYAGAARVVAGVIAGTSLTEALQQVRVEPGPSAVRAAVHDLAHTTLRAYGVLHALLAGLLHRAPTDPLVHALLFVTLADLRVRRDKAYAAVDQAVRATRVLGCHPASGLVNAVLRNYLRRADALEASAADTLAGKWQHPEWWIELVQSSYPDAWQQVLHAGNAHPPMTLRVNRRRTSVAAYCAALEAAGLAATALGEDAIRIDKPVPVGALPGFADGLVSVQDLGAQRAARYLDMRAGQRVLDACAAPGGKTTHILEQCDCSVVAIDDDALRCERIRANLARVGLVATVCAGDAASPEAWWDGATFDRILLDAPCSASGIVRRHPDIKWHRRPSDLARYAQTQSRLLEALWRLLAPGGKLLYATCSVFPIENRARIEAFLGARSDAAEVPLNDLQAGQLLPAATHDGFFYALLEKR